MIMLSSLERFARGARRARDGTRCEVCAAPVAEHAHRHVVDRIDRRLLCACSVCALAFTGATASRLRTVPERVRAAPDGTFGVAELSALGVPVGLAFFFRPSNLGRWVAVFPSPAGPTEAEISDEAWAALTARSDLVRAIEDDVEALLVRRRRDGSCDGYAVPIDACYALGAVLRERWQGIDGGDPVRRAVDAFFEELAVRGREDGER